MTKTAQWLNETFFNLDYFFAEVLHKLAERSNGALTPFMNFISFFGKGGIMLIIGGGILIFFKKTRKAGICVLLALLIGSLITNVCLKSLIARPRPYTNSQSDFYIWWQYVGAVTESEFSFPSGHTTAATAAMTALFFNFPKKYSWTAFLFAVLMGISRIYLMVHYASDVIGGFIAGFIAGVASYIITEKIFKIITDSKRKTQSFEF